MQSTSANRKKAVITGGTGTIGSAMVEIISKRYDVIFTYLQNKNKAAELEKLYGAKAVRCDITDINISRRLAAKYDCDLLINNAGIAQIKQFQDITELDWYKMMDVHLTGAFYFTQAFLPGMISRKSGCVINISSVWGVTGASCEVHYSTAKAGMIGFTKALAKEVGPSNVRVNCIAPGVIAIGTNQQRNMNHKLTAEELESLREATPLQRLGSAKEVAVAALYLAGAEFVTGQVLGVDGGFGV
jgi:3-oxoacyl-[acyl-carrier protein] reductase